MRKLTLEIKQDENPESPREWGGLSKMICFHNRHVLGDKHNLTIEEAKALFPKMQKEGVALPLYLYDHGGISMATSNTSWPFNCRWDSGMVGFIYADRKMILEMFGKEKLTKGMKGGALSNLEKEVETYNQYLQGDVYGYIIKDEQGDCVDSCWGFYGEEDAKEQGASALKYLTENEAKQFEEAKSIMAL
jgi:hypothetical protein